MQPTTSFLSVLGLLALAAPLIAAQTNYEILTESCRASTGQNQFCTSWPPVEVLGADFAGTVSANASSSCSPNDNEWYCYEQKSGNVTCDLCTANSSATNLISGGQWQSGLQSSSEDEVTLEIHFGRLMILFSIDIQFATTSTVALEIERSVNDGWIPIQNFSSLSTTDDSVQVTLATADSYFNAVQTRSSLSSLDDWEARSIRIVFLKSRNGTLAAPATNEMQFFHYGISAMNISALCQCNGHATSCNMTNAACDCEHDTDGDECTLCSTSNSTSASPASIAEGADTCKVSSSSGGSDDDLSTTEIIIISTVCGAILLILIILLIIILVRRQRRGRAELDGTYIDEEITVIDSKGLRSIVIKNKAMALDTSMADTSLMGEDSAKGR